MSEKVDTNIRHVVLSPSSREELCKHFDSFGHNVADAIENGYWWIPLSTIEFQDVKRELNEAFHSFFKLPQDVKVVVVDYDADIMSFKKGH